MSVNDKIQNCLDAEKLYEMYKQSQREAQFWLEHYLKKVQSIEIVKEKQNENS